MACGNCGSGGCSTGGCGTKGGCSSDCGKMGTFDWLVGIEDPASYPRFDLVEVRFKGGRKEIFRNSDNLDIVLGDAVIVDVQGGHHLGYVSLTGELVKLQMKKKNLKETDEIRKIYRIASQKDAEKFEEYREKEGSLLYKARSIIMEQKLEMKLSDVEFQADGTKATFYYSAEDRVDFRELIKALATEFKVRVEMRQISLRQEAGRLGGIGVCGRELCCSTWLTDFKTVATSAARYQSLSVNPAKISGQCGRLKCCLNYELDTYMEALKDIPEVNILKTSKGDLRLQKTDIFRRVMWFSLDNDTDWKPLSVTEVIEIHELNKQGKTAEAFTEIEIEKKIVVEEDRTVNLEDNLERLDKKFKKQGKKPNHKHHNKPKLQNNNGGGNNSGGNNNPNRPNRPNNNPNNNPNRNPNQRPPQK